MERGVREEVLVHTHPHAHTPYRCVKHELGHESYVALSLFTEEVEGPGSAIKWREDFSPMSEARCGALPGSFSPCVYSHVHHRYYSGIRPPYLYSHVVTAGRHSEGQSPSEERAQVFQPNHDSFSNF